MSAIDELAKINLDELTPLQAAVCFLYKSHPEDATKAAEELARLQAIEVAAEQLAERLMVRRVYGWLNTSEADALAAYKKAKAGEQ